MRKVIILVLSVTLLMLISGLTACDGRSKEERHDRELLNFLGIDPREIKGRECLDISPPSAPEVTLRDIAEDQYTTHKLIREKKKWLTYVDVTLILDEVEDVFWESIKLPINVILGKAIEEYGTTALKVLWGIKTVFNPPGFGLTRQVGELLYATGDYLKNKSFLNGQFHIYFCLLGQENGINPDLKSFTIDTPFKETVHEGIWSDYNTNAGYLPSVLWGCGMSFPEARPTDPERITPEYVKFLTKEAWQLAYANYRLDIDKAKLREQILACETGEQKVTLPPAPTPPVTLIPSPTPCPAEGEPKFSLGQEVITTDALKVRENPGLTTREIKTQPKGTSGKILEGPACVDNYVWWKVEYQDGVIGWSAEDWLEARAITITTPTILTPIPIPETPTPLPEIPTPTPPPVPSPAPFGKCEPEIKVKLVQWAKDHTCDFPNLIACWMWSMHWWEDAYFSDCDSIGNNTWAVGYLHGIGGYGSIVHSPDYGQSWEIQWTDGTFGPNPFAVDFLNSSEGFVATDDNILHTLDGGKTWQEIFRVKSYPGLKDWGVWLRGFQVIDRLHLWGRLSEGIVIKTEDGGRTWFYSEDDGKTWQSYPQ